MDNFLESMKYFQDHGGIVITIIGCFFCLGFVYAMLRGIDHYRLHKRIDSVERRAVDRTATHELYWHDPDRTPVIRKNLPWTGEERRTTCNLHPHQG